MQNANDHIEHMEKTAQGVMKACEEAGDHVKNHMDATLKAATIVGKAMEESAKIASGMFNESMMRGVEAGKQMMNAKTLSDAMNTHSEFLKDCFDTYVAGTGKISEISARMAQEAMNPIAENTNNAMNKFAQKVKQAA